MDQRSESDTEATVDCCLSLNVGDGADCPVMGASCGEMLKFFLMNNNFLKIYFVILSDLVIIHP